LDEDSTTTERIVVAARPLTAALLIIGLLMIFLCSYLQYVIPGLNFVSAVLLVYGIPILVTGLISGRAIVRRALNQTLNAVKYGLGYFGAFTALSILVGIFIVFLLSILNPAAVNLLQKPNPVLQVSPGVAWLMVGVSFLLVGPAEEYLFRGFVFGGLLSFFKNRHWLSVALASAIFFASVHMYYAVVYGVASLVQFVDLAAFGMAMAATYYISGGNLIVPALIHGAYDATAFIGVATSASIGNQLRELMIFIGVFVAVAIFAQRRTKNVGTVVAQHA
jgi:membrane protease YdiL (CAAX protease family)